MNKEDTEGTQKRENKRRARDAGARTAFNNLREKTDLPTKRMAGATLAAILAPSVIGALDDEEGFSTASGSVLGVLGATTGGYIGFKNAHSKLATEELKDAIISEAMAGIKIEGKKIAAETGNAQEGINHMARRKAQLIEEISPIDPTRAATFNNWLRDKPFIDDLAGIDLLNRSPREVRGMTKGALLGALTAMVPAYFLTRAGEPATNYLNVG